MFMKLYELAGSNIKNLSILMTMKTTSDLFFHPDSSISIEREDHGRGREGDRRSASCSWRHYVRGTIQMNEKFMRTIRIDYVNSMDFIRDCRRRARESVDKINEWLFRVIPTDEEYRI